MHSTGIQKDTPKKVSDLFDFFDDEKTNNGNQETAIELEQRSPGGFQTQSDASEDEADKKGATTPPGQPESPYFGSADSSPRSQHKPPHWSDSPVSYHKSALTELISPRDLQEPALLTITMFEEQYELYSFYQLFFELAKKAIDQSNKDILSVLIGPNVLAESAELMSGYGQNNAALEQENRLQNRLGILTLVQEHLDFLEEAAKKKVLMDAFLDKTSNRK